ncbi:MAG: DUF3857 domain-containing protein [Cytophagales bacterium]|uniref:DUF3857 domain-containing protein n=1 Tax=Cyclobacterium marinum TaxID=104 RepID=UPI0030DBC4BB|nr:DUF3857 domain-containing protein [Cytophagales bacterium]|tara:strand:- start:92861 stop:94831 length:1971 start_codon:yes stop_codon:yes gene_type:complete
MTFLNYTIGLFILFISPNLLFSQELRFGKYNDAEFIYSEVEFEPEADAVVLQESSYNIFLGVTLESKIHRRIKVLKESGKEQANVILKYYKGDDRIQDIYKLKAQTVNFVNEEIQIEKLSKSDFYEVDAGNGWREIRFTFPQVQVGSIIDFTYVKADKSILSIDGWVFQNEIPTLKSIYDITFPEFIWYKSLKQGIKTISHDFKTKTKDNYRWELDSLKGFTAEPYMTHYRDYLEKVSFQLEGYEYRELDSFGMDLNQYKSLFDSWQDLTDFFADRLEFKSYLSPKKKTQQITGLESEGTDTLKLAMDIYEHVSDEYNYSGMSAIVPSKDFSETIESKNGNRAEINLSLLAHLRNYGIIAYPVLISSKGNGRSNLVPFPFVDQFNQLIVVTSIANKVYYLDATDSSIPFGFLPSQFLVNQGFLMLEENSGLIDIQTHHSSGYFVFDNIHIEDEVSLKRETAVKAMGFDGVYNADLFNAENNSSDALREKLMTNEQGNLNPVFTFEKIPNTNQTLIKYTTSKEIDKTQNLYINPFQLLRWEPNPFVRSSRTFPIDFGYLFTDRYGAKIEIPAGYTLDDYPENVAMTLPSGAISFSYKVNIINETAIINSVITVSNQLIGPEEYPDLKYLIDIISSKFKEPLVLVKNQTLAPESNSAE